MNKHDPSAIEKSSSRKRYFKIITIGFPVILFILLEGLLRLIAYGDNLNLFISNPIEGYRQYMMVNPNVGKKYFQKFEITSPPNDIFLKRKPAGTFRIFVLGSSTVVGFPYEYNLMFSRILHSQLQDSYPEKDIEIVNTAITAINSYTLLDYASQVAKYEPDVILIYAGHNEFYGAFGVGSNESMSKSRTLTMLHLWFMDLRFYQLFRNIANSTIQKIGSGRSKQVHGTLMKRIVGNKDIGLESDDYQLAMERYRQNMGDLINIFNKKGVPIFLSEVCSNVKDIKPLSYLSMGTENEPWKVYIEAAEAYHQADYEHARQLFYKAKDLDGVRFRASEEVNEIIRELSIQHKTYLIPMLHQFQSNSNQGIIGNNLMTEHVHPNMDGSFLMADAFFTEILKSGILGEAEEDLIHPSDYYKNNWGYSQLDSLLAHHRIANLKTHWPFVPVDANQPDYRATHRPVSALDSIAFKAFIDPELSLVEARLELARAYEQQGNHLNAYKEYQALLFTNPYLAVNYRDAASSLIQLGDLPMALKYFTKSLEYEPSFYASYRIGEIYLIKGDYIQARKSFEEAFSIASENSDKIKTLGKLYMTCMYGNQKTDAQAIRQQLQKYDAGQYLKIPPKAYTYHKYIPFQTKVQISTAQQLISDGMESEALSILEESLKIYDSHMAQRYLGELYLKMDKLPEARYHLERVYTEFAFDPQFLTELIKLHTRLGEDLRAELLLNELKSIDPDFHSIPLLTLLVSEEQIAQ